MIFDNIITREPIDKGFSGDKKFCGTAADGTRYLLRISPMTKHEQRKDLFHIMQRVAAAGVPMCAPLEFGVCADGVYAIHEWVYGKDLEDALPTLPHDEQYALGLMAGGLLKKMHGIPAPDTQESWARKFNQKIDIRIAKYRDCGLHFKGDEHVIAYINQNRHLLNNRPQSFQHGDYHVNNLMLEGGGLRVIDFCRYDFGDPWEEFTSITWCVEASPPFAVGRIHGYFNGEPPTEFFNLLALYIASTALSSIYWAIPFGQEQIDIMINQAHDVLTWFDNMQNPVPTWYNKGS